MSAEPEEEAAEGAPAWMATFADLMSLLLTFFVLLLSFANMDVDNFRMALGSVKDALGVENEHPGHLMGLTTSVVEFSKKESTSNLDILDDKTMTKLKRQLKAQKMVDKIDVSSEKRGIVLRVKDQVLFSSGQAKFRGKAAGVLAALTTVAGSVEHPIWIEGHTDDRPIKTTRFPSNWELSTARATAVLRHMIERGKLPARRFRAAGYADTRPLASNKTLAGRSKNRRVEFVLVHERKSARVDLKKQLRTIEEQKKGNRSGEQPKG